MPKSWVDKYYTRKESVVKVVSRGFADVKPGMTMLISTPSEVQHEVWKIHKGHQLTLKQFRNKLADIYGVDKACPLTTSIFLRIDAEISLEKLLNGAPICRVMPFWRVISSKSPLAKKLSCGTKYVEWLRSREGLPV